ncbi:OHCU decarboxylase [Pseudomonas flavescens]|uniref:2-oxo-4-hydroxy-4-carboxy-5-ureidoimidazoline decarboxylase n=1 Tax=Phytopseudomonas flavescens TaxID=29435 RepID=A0A1G8J0A6_9GAMM|nr:2-oxo-4-hydroxy-4-carboxy-5-ureidoimidazoline decarboxylase [Pseudomonas flavescens]SDI24659.1 OHCU decarboxylase [Pseudomonas flavescens]
MSRFKSIRPSALGREQFICTFGDIYEHSPWIAECAFDAAQPMELDDVDLLHGVMQRILLSADTAEQLRLINLHPDLAGKAAVRGELTAASTAEQAGAGIQACSIEEFERFNTLNAQYRERFGFPFVKAVKGSDRQQILAAFEERLHNTQEQELATALDEIGRIALFRLRAL